MDSCRGYFVLPVVRVKRNSQQDFVGILWGDRYGRTLGYIFIEDQAINTMMVRMGMAWWYRRYDKTEELENAERYAKENKIGLWADPNPIAPWDWRKRLFVTALFPLACAALSMVHRPTCRRIRLLVDRLAWVQFIRLRMRKPAAGK